jgi:hypothetical protein
MVSVDELATAVRGQVEETLAFVAATINRAPNPIPLADSVQQVGDTFADLRWEALNCAWQIRLAAEATDSPSSAGPPESRSAQPQPTPSGNGETPCRQRPSGSWGEKYRQMKVADAGILPVESEPRPDEEMTAEARGKDAEAKPPSWKTFGESLLTNVEKRLERLADTVKNAMLDWDITDQGETLEPALRHLPPIAREAFAQALRGKAEETLRCVADVVNEAGDVERIHDLLAELLWNATNTGIQMRLDAAEAGFPAPRLSDPSTRQRGQEVQQSIVSR